MPNTVGGKSGCFIFEIDCEPCTDVSVEILTLLVVCFVPVQRVLLQQGESDEGFLLASSDGRARLDSCRTAGELSASSYSHRCSQHAAHCQRGWPLVWLLVIFTVHSYAEHCLRQRYSNSVCLSVTRRYCVKTSECRMMPSSQLGSTLTLVIGNIRFINMFARCHP